eukprot:9820221-Heterocapsa_arctica.AAC.1
MPSWPSCARSAAWRHPMGSPLKPAATIFPFSSGFQQRQPSKTSARTRRPTRLCRARAGVPFQAEK